MANAGTVQIDFAAETAKFTSELQKVNRRLKGMEDDFNSFGSVVTKVSGVFAGFVSAQAILSFAKQTFTAADALATAAEKAGTSVESFSRLKFAAEQSDVEIGSLSTGIKELQKSLSLAASGSASAEKEFAAFGLQASALRGLGLEDQLGKIADAFKEIANPADQTRIAVELFGKAGTDLIPFLNQGSVGIRELTAEADRLGITLSTQTAAGINAADQALKKLSATWSGLFQGVIGENALFLLGADEKDAISVAARDIVVLKKARDSLTASAGAVGIFDAKAIEDYNRQIAEAEAKLQKLVDTRNRAAGDAAARRAFNQQLDDFNRETERLEAQQAAEAARDAEQQAAIDARLDRELEAQRALMQVRRAAERERIEQRRLETEMIEQIDQEALERSLQRQVDEATAKFEVQSSFAAAMVALRREYGIREIEFEELKGASLQEIGQSVAISGLQIATALFGENKKVSAAIAAINVATAATEALRLPFPANLAAVAKVLSAGAQLQSRIRSTSIGGSTVNQIGGIAGVSSIERQTLPESIAEGAKGRAQTVIAINGGNFAGPESARWIVEAIRNELDRDVTLFGVDSRQTIDVVPA